MRKPRLPSTIPPLFLLLLLLHLCTPTQAARKQLYEIPEFNNDRISSISTSSPTARRFRANDRLREQVEPLFALFQQAATIMDNRLIVQDRLACNLDKDHPWRRPAERNTRLRQIGVLSDNCNSRLDVNEAIQNEALPSGFVERSRRIIRAGNEAIFQAMGGIDEVPNGANWTAGPSRMAGWEILENDQTCTVETALAYRFREKIHIRMRITNHEVNSYVPSFQRQFIDEMVADDFTDSIRMWHRKNGSLDELEPSTTIVSKFNGRAGFSQFSQITVQTNPAISEAIRLNELAIDQANEALTISNIAILALPMVMSLIPVAFVADLNTLATLWYIIFTDVFSVLPFLIKGVELIDSASNARTEMSVFYSGNGTLGTMEMWAAECTGENTFRVTGIAFVCIAIFALLFGIFLEVVASRTMRRIRLAKGMAAGGPFGIAAFDNTKFSPLGRVDDGVAEWERRYSTAEEERWMEEEEEGGTAMRRSSKEVLDDMELVNEEEEGRGKWWEFRRRRKRKELQEMVAEYQVELGLRQRASSVGAQVIDEGEGVVGAGEKARKK